MTPSQPTPETIARAAGLLREGRLIGMPTETVYGIAADATQPAAVRAVFALKGRPSDNPLIVHLARAEGLERIAAEVPEEARTLAAAFWPGPFTLVLPRGDVPDEVTGGLDTVAVRVPDHPVALGLIQTAGVPVAAPSANLFMGISPTRAEDIAPEVAVGLAMILDGGPCPVGVESTVVDATGWPFRLLRPGGIERAAIEAVLGAPLGGPGETARRSPGLYRRHYSPRTRLILVDRLGPDQAGITFGAPTGPHQAGLPAEAKAYARALYSTMQRLDEGGYDELAIERPPEEPEWEAVWDRLLKAASGRV